MCTNVTGVVRCAQHVMEDFNAARAEYESLLGKINASKESMLAMMMRPESHYAIKQTQYKAYSNLLYEKMHGFIQEMLLTLDNVESLEAIVETEVKKFEDAEPESDLELLGCALHEALYVFASSKFQGMFENGMLPSYRRRSIGSLGIAGW